jgi:hypothetical protein
VTLSGSLDSRAGAQGLYYRTIPIGERAIGMGGAYTGISNDPSATYYNPAGIMSGGRFQLLGSLSSLVFTRRTIDGAFDSEIVDASFKSTGTTTLPHFIGTVVKMGKEKFGDRQFAVAFSSLEVAREDLGVGFTEVNPEGSADLRLGNYYNMRWWGLSFGAQVTRKVSVGFSAFLSRQSGNYSEDLGLASGGTLEPTGERVGGDSLTSSTAISLDAYHFVFRLGSLYRINPRWQIGFMFQPPGIPLKQKGNVYRRLTQDVSPDPSRYFIFDRGDIPARAPIPFELRVGFEYKINPLTTLSFDAAINGPGRGGSVFDRPPELQGYDGRLGAYFANSTNRRWTPNLAIGAEHLFGKVVVAGGLFTNISAGTDVPATSEVYLHPQVSMFGASFAIGVDAKGYRLTLGATGYYGKGDALAFVLDRDTLSGSYERTKATVSAVVLYIAGAVSVAAKGAKQVETKYKKRKASKNGVEDGELGEEAEAETETETETETEPALETEAETETETEPVGFEPPAN